MEKLVEYLLTLVVWFNVNQHVCVLWVLVCVKLISQFQHQPVRKAMLLGGEFRKLGT